MGLIFTKVAVIVFSLRPAPRLQALATQGNQGAATATKNYSQSAMGSVVRSTAGGKLIGVGGRAGGSRLKPKVPVLQKTAISEEMAGKQSRRGMFSRALKVIGSHSADAASAQRKSGAFGPRSMRRYPTLTAPGTDAARAPWACNRTCCDMTCSGAAWSKPSTSPQLCTRVPPNYCASVLIL